MELENTLYLDCGNTRAKYRYQGEYGVLPYAEVQRFFTDNQPASVVYSSVAGARQEITTAADSLEIAVARCTVEQGFGDLTLAYEDVSRLGVDRWLAMLQARALFSDDYHRLLIADAGTALTMDILNSPNQHAGGLIAPGLRMSASSLFKNTVDLPEVLLEDAPGLGIDTRSCINYGVVHSAVALIESTVVRFGSNESQLIITGGDAGLISRHLSMPFLYQPNLVVDGLYLYWKLKILGETTT
ncbi:type III pantothenate kinase [Reinekea marinisedimentorum]|uniref:Type III pantothenate kinase n=1 Tax=Reinekea marinisedimentorum TaxID=230495 RepID=A0A4R3HWX5_9GAMM|nr:type III pantothenate kinase [Reinekea marinisedimentorum]TCS37648.1 type III pantothenate kinase [Reinekea marinisedimentorum]